MQLKTTDGLDIGFMTISNVLFRQQKQKGQKNGVTCNAAIFADSIDTKSNVFQSLPTIQAGLRQMDTLDCAICILASSKVLPFKPCTSNVYACNHRVNCYEDDRMHMNLHFPLTV